MLFCCNDLDLDLMTFIIRMWPYPPDQRSTFYIKAFKSYHITVHTDIQSDTDHATDCMGGKKWDIPVDKTGKSVQAIMIVIRWEICTSVAITKRQSTATMPANCSFTQHLINILTYLMNYRTTYTGTAWCCCYTITLEQPTWWRSGTVVARWSSSTKLTYIGTS